MQKTQRRLPTPEQTQNIFGLPLSIFGLPVDRDTIFLNERNIYKSKIEKRQRHLIAKITFIKFFLNHGEVIRTITTGYSPISWMEQLLTGLAFLYFKRAIFIFTDQRILHVPTSFNRSPHSSVSQIMYEDCAAIAIKGSALIISYKNGRQETFPYVARKERKKIRALIQQLPIKPKEAGRLQERVYLCPSCARVLPKGTKKCDHCQLPFKNRLCAQIRALLIPGGGYLYSGHPILALGLGAFEIALVGIVVAKATGYSQFGWISNLPVVLSSILMFILIKWISRFHTLELIRDYMPDTKDFTQRKI